MCFSGKIFFSSLLVLLGGVRVPWRQSSLAEDTRKSVDGFRLLLGSSMTGDARLQAALRTVLDVAAVLLAIQTVESTDNKI
jgi:hypothetical protein